MRTTNGKLIKDKAHSELKRKLIAMAQMIFCLLVMVVALVIIELLIFCCIASALWELFDSVISRFTKAKGSRLIFNEK